MAANTDVIRRMLGAVRRQDRDEFVACVTPDVEWDDREGWPGVRRMYHGATGVRQWWDAFTRVGGKLVSAEIEDLAETSDQRVLLGVYGTFRGQSGGREDEFAARAWYVFWLRNGKVARARLYWDRGEAFEAAGLSA